MESKKSPWKWVPSLYFAEGVPNVVVVTVALVMYENLGLSNTEVALYTSWLYLPWVIKPFWSPIVDVLRQKRWWILAMQFMVGLSLSGVAYTIDAPDFVQTTLAFFWLMAFSSATHDIAADGFYMLGLTPHEQSLFVGIRSTFYRFATIGAQGGLLAFADSMQTFGKCSTQEAWKWTFWVTAFVFFVLFLWHNFSLPMVEMVVNEEQKKDYNIALGALKAFVTFFTKPYVFTAILFLLLYRFPEALLVKVAPLFLMDSVAEGGLALTKMDLALAQGTIGVIGLTLGGLVGGLAIAKFGFKRCLWGMVGAITLPHAVYVLLAYAQVSDLWVISTAVGFEQFGYGFGFTAYMMYMIYFSEGASKTTHYALCTAFMALSMLLPGMIAGWLQEQLGYFTFFVLVLGLTPLTCLAAALIKVKPNFGKKESEMKQDEAVGRVERVLSAQQQESNQTIVNSSSQSVDSPIKKEKRICGLWIGVIIVVLVGLLAWCFMGNNKSVEKVEEIPTAPVSQPPIDGTVVDTLQVPLTEGVPVSQPIDSTVQGNEEFNALSFEEKVWAVIRGDMGNGQERKDALGEEYDEIQKNVNELYSKGLVN